MNALNGLELSKYEPTAKFYFPIELDKVTNGTLKYVNTRNLLVFKTLGVVSTGESTPWLRVDLGGDKEK